MLKNGWATSELKHNECEYQEKESKLREHFINVIKWYDDRNYMKVKTQQGKPVKSSVSSF